MKFVWHFIPTFYIGETKELQDYQILDVFIWTFSLMTSPSDLM